MRAASRKGTGTRGAAAAALLAVGLWAALATRGEAQRLELVAPEDVQADTLSLLAIELAARAGFPSPPPEAEVFVTVAPGFVRVSCEPVGQAVQTPVRSGADARTLALIAASLIGEACVPPAAEPSLATRALSDPRGEPPPPTTAPPLRSTEEDPAALYGGLGLALLMTHDNRRRTEGGGALAWTFGVRVFRWLRVGLSGTLGGIQSSAEEGFSTEAAALVQLFDDSPMPHLTAQLEVIATLPLGDVSLHLAPTGGIVMSIYRFIAPWADGRRGHTDDFAVGLSVGGLVAASFRLVGDTQLWIRGDMGLSDRDVSNRHPRIGPDDELGSGSLGSQYAVFARLAALVTLE